MCFFLSTVYKKDEQSNRKTATGFVFQSPPMAVRHLHRTRLVSVVGCEEVPSDRRGEGDADPIGLSKIAVKVGLRTCFTVPDSII